MWTQLLFKSMAALSLAALISAPAQRGDREAQQQQAWETAKEPAQTNPAYQTQLSLATTLTPLPSGSPPEFKDPADAAASDRLQTLVQEFTQSRQSSGKPFDVSALYRDFGQSLKDRARTLATQYGPADPRSIQALEDIGIAAMLTHDQASAKAAADEIIRVLAPQSQSSPAYARALKRRCQLEVTDSDQDSLPVCEEAVEIRSPQSDATPLELAAWMRLLGLMSQRNPRRSLDYQERADGFYAKVPGISVSFLAGDYRRLTMTALMWRDFARAARLNELTNTYLAQGDAGAHKAMVSTDVITRIEEAQTAAAMPRATPDPTSVLSEQQKQALAQVQARAAEFKKEYEALEKVKPGGATALNSAKGDQSMRGLPPELLKTLPEEKRREIEAIQSQLQKIRAELQAQQKPYLDAISGNTKTANELATGRPQDAMVNMLLRLGQMRGSNAPLAGNSSSGNASPPPLCNDDGKKITNLDLMTAFSRARTAAQNLDFFSSVGFGLTSLLETCDNDDLYPQSHGVDPNVWATQPSHPVNGYASMVRLKGAFAETLARRKLTILPGLGAGMESQLQAAPGEFDRMVNALIVLLPADEKRRLMKLPPDERATAANEYWEDLQKNHPEQAEKLEQQARHTLQTSADVARLQEMAASLRDQIPKDARPLAFLDLLKPDEVFVDVYEYKVLYGEKAGSDRYLAVITDSRRMPRKVQLGPTEAIDSSVRAFRAAINGGSDGVEEWKALQQRVVDPLLAALPEGTQRVWLSPDSTFNFVPFASLLLDRGSPIEIAMIPSPYDFVRLRSQALPGSAGKALLVGDLEYGPGSEFAYMAQTREELETLSRKAGEIGLPYETLSGDRITATVVSSHLRNIRFLHFSTHGFLDNPSSRDQDLLKGGLALSMANSLTPASQLTAEDIRRLDLSSTELAVLSACDTGKGRLIESQGLLGFQTAFMAAGVRSLLFSLWKAPLDRDKSGAYATSVFMDAFYDGIWIKKLSKAEALRRAQAAVRSNPKFANPRFWATWVLVGEAW
jgi:CHAT domain-containing protein